MHERCPGTESNGDAFSPTFALGRALSGHTIKFSLQLSLFARHTELNASNLSRLVTWLHLTCVL